MSRSLPIQTAHFQVEDGKIWAALRPEGHCVFARVSNSDPRAFKLEGEDLTEHVSRFALVVGGADPASTHLKLW